MGRIKGWGITGILLGIIAIVLAGCGGGGGGGGGASASAPPTYSISGTVSGNATSGVKITLSGGASSATTTTDATGKYTLSGLANGSYTVTPSLAGNAFNPVSTAVTISGANVTGQNFTAVAAAVTYSLSGRATLGSATGSAVSGVTIGLGGANTGTTVTDVNGNYSFSGLVGGQYTLTPGSMLFTFTPKSLSGTIGANLTGLNFAAAAALPTYSISGTVSGNVSAGVIMALTGSGSTMMVTASNGTYSFTGLPNGTYIVTPSAAGNTFNPGSTTVTVNNANVSGQNFTSTAIAAGVAPITISGQVTGAWVDQVPITISNGGGTVTTNATGNYSSATLAGGTSYTLTPSLPGYNFSPASAVVSASTTTANFAASAVLPSYTISGTVTYAGAQTGRVYVNAMPAAGINTVGTVINLTAGSGTFTLRGAPANTYTVSAQMDTLGTNAFNAANASGVAATTATVGPANATGVAITMNDPGAITPVVPVLGKIFPGDKSALIYWAQPMTVVGPETDTAYKIYWGTDAAATNGTPVVVGARGTFNNGGGTLLLPGLTNGANYYFKMSGLAGATESAPTPVVGPIMIGPATGLNTVSGTVTFSGSVPALVVELQNTALGGGVIYQRIANPVSPQAYSIAGAANGTYIVQAFLDLNNNGIPDAGDISNMSSSVAPAPQITVAGNATANLNLWATNSSSNVQTSHIYILSPLSDTYTETFDVWGSYKTPVAVTLVSAPNMAVPLDLGTYSGYSFGYFGNPSGVAPKVGDVFKVRVTYSDGTSEYINIPVTGVLNLAQNLAPNALTAAGQTVPTFTWAAPLNPPASYEYSLSVVPTVGVGFIWYSPLMPSTQTSVVFNSDGKASQAALTVGTSYTWNLNIRDKFGNSSWTQAQYTP